MRDVRTNGFLERILFINQLFVLSVNLLIGILLEKLNLEVKRSNMGRGMLKLTESKKNILVLSKKISVIIIAKNR